MTQIKIQNTQGNDYKLKKTLCTGHISPFKGNQGADI